MRADTIAFMAVRLLALYLGVRVASLLVQVVTMPGLWNESLVALVVQVVVAAVLWTWASAISIRLLGGVRDPLPDDDEGPREISLRAADLVRAAVTIIGVWFTAEALVHLAFAVASLFSGARLGPGSDGFDLFWYQMRFQALGDLAQLVLGVVLIVGADRIASRLTRSWTLRRGVVRASRVELRDGVGDVRAMIGVEDDPDGGETAAFTLFDDELRPRVRVVTDRAPTIEMLDESGSSVWRAPQ